MLTYFFPLKSDSLILKTHFISLRGVSKMHFSCPLRLHYTAIPPFCDRATANSKWDLGVLELGWQWLFFLCKICFRGIPVVATALRIPSKIKDDYGYRLCKYVPYPLTILLYIKSIHLFKVQTIAEHWADQYALCRQKRWPQRGKYEEVIHHTYSDEEIQRFED